MPNKSDTRNRILDATWTLFSDMTPDAPTLGDIAKAAGVSRQAVYLHFDNRARLLSETIEKQKLEVRAAERLRKTRDAEPGMVLTLWVGTMFELHEIILPLGRAFITTALVDEDGASAWDEVIASVRRSARFVIEHFDGLGMLQAKWSVETAADWLYSRMSFSTWHVVVHELGWSQELAVERTVESLEVDLLNMPG